MSNKAIRCSDEEAYIHVAERMAFYGDVFSSKWRTNNRAAGERYVVSGWVFGGYSDTGQKVSNKSQFIPLLVWEWDNWYATSGSNSWMCNALNAGIHARGHSIRSLTPKDMLVMMHYGIGGVALAMEGTGIENGMTGIYALDNDNGKEKV